MPQTCQPTPQDDDTTYCGLARKYAADRKKKRYSNKQILKELMEKRYQSRRKSITSKEVKETIIQYPCLKDYDEVSVISFKA